MVKSVDRALRIISLISKQKEGMGVTELGERLGIGKSSTYKLLSTLTEHGYIEQDEGTKKYRLGYKYLELSALLLESMDIRSLAAPFLKEVEAITNEVVHLVVYDQGEIVYIEKLEGNEILRTHSKVGRRAPVHCTSVGKVILSHLEDREVRNILTKQGMAVHTENTITSIDEFLKEIHKVNKQGFAVEKEENEVGITCIAAPIFDNRGKIAAAVSISGPSIRMSDKRLQELKPLIMKTGKQISNRLGYVE
ncbi:IclR family transcriptional regulator [Thalassobacillus sp. C254]|uniref:IclR family transcriptional regulator n=1 Tax=Thalassobacillus sp. C254 TaxID=1225341 RepID=UPI000A81D4B7|nr:IclR family transcriptional regulator [Thalassobacillus sp. C254]